MELIMFFLFLLVFVPATIIWAVIYDSRKKKERERAIEENKKREEEDRRKEREQLEKEKEQRKQDLLSGKIKCASESEISEKLQQLDRIIASASDILGDIERNPDITTPQRLKKIQELEDDARPLYYDICAAVEDYRLLQSNNAGNYGVLIGRCEISKDNYNLARRHIFSTANDALRFGGM